MTARWIIVCSALLLVVIANEADGRGAYQRTRSGRALVWNTYPRPNDAVTWSGRRDKAGKATGYGTVTWYTVKQEIVTGSNIPSPKYVAISRYTGKMVEGKLEGPVIALGANGKIFHATFAEGRKTTEWAAGPVPVAKQQREERPFREPVVEAPSQEPATASGERIKTHVPEPAARETPRREMDESLRSLVGPPPALRISPSDASAQAPAASTTSSPPALGHLTAAKVIELADAEARAQGYDLAIYQRPQAQYAAGDNTWSIFYDPKSDAKNERETAKHFSVTVDDKTEKASITLKH